MDSTSNSFATKILQFDGLNYNNWQYRLKILLDKEGLTKYIEIDLETILTEEKDTQKHPKMRKEEKTCISFIVQSIHDSQLEYVKDQTTAKGMIDNLKQVFERKSIAGQLLLRKQLLTMKYDEKDNITDHFLQFDKRIRELKSIGAKMEDMDVICHLILTLPKSFDNLITALETMNAKDLSLEFVKARLLDEYGKRHGRHDEHGNSNKAMAMHTKSAIVCHHCGKSGHKKAQCFKLKGNMKKTHSNKSSDANNTSSTNENDRDSSVLCAFIDDDETPVSDDEANSIHSVAQYDEIQSERECSAMCAILDGDKNSETCLNVSVEAHNAAQHGEICFVLDSGATEHMVNDASYFDKLADIEQININVAKRNQKLVANQQGEIKVTSFHNGQSKTRTIKEVLHVRDLKCNLMSIRTLTKRGFKVVFEDDFAYIIFKGETQFIGRVNGKLYEVRFQIQRNVFAGVANENELNKLSQNLWHFRLGHLNVFDMKRMIKHNMIKGIENVQVNTDDKFCESCVVSKHTRSTFPKNQNGRSSRVLEFIHSDVCGPISQPSWDGTKYFVTFTDDYSRASSVFFVERKSEVFGKFKEYVAMVEALHGCKIAKLRVDNGGEYTSNEFKDFCAKKGIQILYTVAYNPEMNGVAERLNRTLQERALAMLTASGLNRHFWNEAILAANYIKNRSPTSAFGKQFIEKTPAEIWFGSKPELSHIKIFGSICYNYIPAENRKKLETKSTKCLFLGYASTHGSYRLWNLESNKLVIGRNVVFDEKSVLDRNKTVIITSEVADDAEDLFPSIRNDDTSLNESTASEQFIDANDTSFDHGNLDVTGDIEDNVHSIVQDNTGNRNNNFHSIEQDNAGDSQDDVNSANEDCTGTNSNVRRSSRATKKPQRFGDVLVPGKYNTWEEASFALNAEEFVQGDPDSIAEAKQRGDWPMWQKAINEEYSSLLKNDTWILCELPPGRKAITCKWVFKLKRKANGDFDKYKARLVARGFSQEKGFDYNETYSPTAKLTTFRILLAIAVHHGYLVHQMDVKCAFLNGLLNEEIYMQQPDGFQKGTSKVCKLNRSLYGLKQASRMWNERFNEFIVKLGFKRCLSDQCLYIKNEKGDVCYILLYVDDLLIISNDLNRIKIIKQLLSKEFEMTDIGEADTFLGMQIQRDAANKMISLSQTNYLKNMVIKFNMADCKGVATPMESNIDLIKNTNVDCDDVPYRELIGCLTYATVTMRPDLCASTNYFSRFQSCFQKEHFTHAKRVLRYIQSTLNLKMVYKKQDNAEPLVGYTDSDWAGDKNDRKSISGYVFKVFGNTVSWASRKQATVSLSSTEAEYISLGQGISEAKWLRSLLNEIGVECVSPTIIQVDNQSCIRVAEESRDHKRMKHINVKFNFIREAVQNKEIALQYIPTGDQTADIMTKGLGKNLFAKHRINLNLF